MKKIDGRTIEDSTRTILKARAKEIRKTGKSYAEIGDILGVHYTTIARWLTSKQNFKFSFKTRGRKIGEQRTLSAEHEKEIRELIRDKTPDQLKLPFMLWTRKAVRDLIRQRTGFEMPIRTIGEYLKRWGYTPQRPLKRAYEQRPGEIRTWLDETYPLIQQRARQENAEIHWGDETGINNEANYGRSYAPAGQTPVVRIRAKHLSTSMISSITNQGKVRFMLYKGGINIDIFKKFLMRLIKDCKSKIFLIIDNLRVHHGIALKEWLDTIKDKIELFFLPSYAPERNPDEYLNNDLKQGLSNKSIPHSIQDLLHNVISHMRQLQKLPEHVISFFKHPMVTYAA